MTHSPFEHDLESMLTSLSAEESERHERMKLRYKPHFADISSLVYETLPQGDQIRFLRWFAKRWAGINRVPTEEFAAYESAIERVRQHTYATETFHGQTYKRLDLSVQGYIGELLTYPWMLGIHDFLFDQYQHGAFQVRRGDTIIDAGAFVGDTALLFHQTAGGDCRIHSFEVLEENLALLHHNLETNDIAAQVHVCPLALSDQSGEFVNIKPTPVQGATSIFGNSDGIKVATITIDDYVRQENIEQVDLIKMDIEGAERLALGGALDTLRNHRPRLAICIYHLWDDVIEIPRIIQSSGVPYHYAFKWVELKHGWEAVLLATPKPPMTP